MRKALVALMAIIILVRIALAETTPVGTPNSGDMKEKTFMVASDKGDKISVFLYRYVPDPANPTSMMREGIEKEYVFVIQPSSDPATASVCKLVTDSDGFADYYVCSSPPCALTGCRSYSFRYCGKFSNNINERRRQFEICTGIPNRDPRSIIDVPFCPRASIDPVNNEDYGSSATYVSYCNPYPLDFTSNVLANLCVPVMIILGLTTGAMFLMGRNPLAEFNLATPHMPRGREYRFRMLRRSLYFNQIFTTLTGGMVRSRLREIGKKKLEKWLGEDSDVKNPDGKSMTRGERLGVLQDKERAGCISDNERKELRELERDMSAICGKYGLGEKDVRAIISRYSTHNTHTTANAGANKIGEMKQGYGKPEKPRPNDISKTDLRGSRAGIHGQSDEEFKHSKLSENEANKGGVGKKRSPMEEVYGAKVGRIGQAFRGIARMFAKPFSKGGLFDALLQGWGININAFKKTLRLRRAEYNGKHVTEICEELSSIGVQTDMSTQDAMNRRVEVAFLPELASVKVNFNVDKSAVEGEGVYLRNGEWVTYVKNLGREVRLTSEQVKEACEQHGIGVIVENNRIAGFKIDGRDVRSITVAGSGVYRAGDKYVTFVKGEGGYFIIELDKDRLSSAVSSAGLKTRIDERGNITGFESSDGKPIVERGGSVYSGKDEIISARSGNIWKLFENSLLSAFGSGDVGTMMGFLGALTGNESLMRLSSVGMNITNQAVYLNSRRW